MYIKFKVLNANSRSWMLGGQWLDMVLAYWIYSTTVYSSLFEYRRILIKLEFETLFRRKQDLVVHFYKNAVQKKRWSPSKNSCSKFWIDHFFFDFQNTQDESHPLQYHRLLEYGILEEQWCRRSAAALKFPVSTPTVCYISYEYQKRCLVGLYTSTSVRYLRSLFWSGVWRHDYSTNVNKKTKTEKNNGRRRELKL